MEIRVSSISCGRTLLMDCNGTVQIPGLNFSESFSVQANTITTVNLPVDTDRMSRSRVQNYGIEIISADDIVVYALNRQPYSTDAALVLPVDSLGFDYMTMNYISRTNATEFAITALYPDTNITIYPTSPYDFYNVDTIEPINISMGKLETYMLSTAYAPKDFTGTFITANKLISVSTGDRCANVPRNHVACDHLFEITPPISTWGKSFLSVPLALRLNGDVFRILASEDDTEVYINGVLVDTLSKSKFHEVILEEASYIEANKPVQVAQYSTGLNYGRGSGDPFMMLVPPFEQYLNSYTFNTLAADQNIDYNYINVIIRSDAINTITLDGEPVDSSLFQQIHTTEYSGAQIPVTHGSHHIESFVPFGLFVYGFGRFESYGYPGGMAFEKINPVGDRFAPNLTLQTVGQSILVRATDNEDINANGVLDLGEDLNSNGVIDIRSEDVNLNGILDDGEDENNDTIIDKDSGIFAIELVDSENLQLEIGNFVPGDKDVEFEISVIDPQFLAQGTLVVSDAVGNKATEKIQILSKFSAIKVQTIVSHDDIDIDLASFAITPSKLLPGADRTMVEWEFEFFEANETQEIDFDVLLKNPQPGEKRLVTYATFLSYVDMSGKDTNISLGEQSIKVYAPEANLLVSTDKAVYGSDENVSITSMLLNRSPIPYTLQLEVSVQDSLGNIVYSFDGNASHLLESNQSVDIFNIWNTRKTFAGTYSLYGVVKDLYGNVMANDKASFYYRGQVIVIVSSFLYFPVRLIIAQTVG